MQFLPRPRTAIEQIGLMLFSATLCAHAIAAPQTALKAKDPAVRDFIESNYGTWEARNKGWREDGDMYVYQVCDVARLTTADGPRYLLAMCGDEMDTGTDGKPEIPSDGTGGQTDLYVLKPASNGKGLEPVLKETGITSGSNGNAAAVSIQQLGPHLYSFVMEGGYTQEGYTQTIRTIWLPRPTIGSHQTGRTAGQGSPRKSRLHEFRELTIHARSALSAA